MQRVQRQFGRVLPRTADESQVGQLIKDFYHAADLLGLLIKSTKAWQQSWKDILDSQERLTAGFLNAAHPILTSSQDSYQGPPPVETPPQVTRKLTKLHRECQALRQELDPDIKSIDIQIIGPATQAKDLMSSMKRTIKTREDCKLDFERYQSRRDAAFRKENRSDRDNVALAKHESDLHTAQDTYERADHALRNGLPGFLNAIYTLIPRLLDAIVRISHTLIANYYTTIHEFCQDESFPMPPPPVSQLISQWAESCKPAQTAIESLSCCVSTKRGRLGAASARAPSGSHSATSPSPRISPSHDDASSIHSQEPVQRIPPSQSQALLSPRYQPSPSPNSVDLLTPLSNTASKPEYFSRDRIPSTSSISSTGDLASIASKKKKPPPPPPPKRGSNAQEVWVTALYDFAGQNQGDLQMKEGDRIKVLKKTDSTNDWWEGECNGMRGSFPANYCKV